VIGHSGRPVVVNSCTVLVATADVCEGWAGIRCNNVTEKVIGVNLTAATTPITPTAPSLPTLKVFSAISNLSHLETLVLSHLGLSGPLDDPAQPALGLHTLRQLQHLDISGNPGITGTLRDKWFGLTALHVLDISGTGVTGTLPSLYASMQDLHEFRAVDCPGISGQLPPEYGLLNLNVLQLTNTALTGTLPSEWANPVALRRMAVASAAALQAAGLDGATQARVASATDGVPVGLAATSSTSDITAGISAAQLQAPGTDGMPVASAAALQAAGAAHGRDASATDGVPVGLQQLRVLDGMAAAAVQALQNASSNTGAVLAATSSTSSAGVAATQLQTTGTNGVPVGLQQLRVLDLSVAGGGSGGLRGSLPGGFAAMKQLEVRYEAVAALDVLLLVHIKTWLVCNVCTERTGVVRSNCPCSLHMTLSGDCLPVTGSDAGCDAWQPTLHQPCVGQQLLYHCYIMTVCDIINMCTVLLRFCCQTGVAGAVLGSSLLQRHHAPFMDRPAAATGA
jgi:hypothetical protein